jgi:hypothetical protein
MSRDIQMERDNIGDDQRQPTIDASPAHRHQRPSQPNSANRMIYMIKLALGALAAAAFCTTSASAKPAGAPPAPLIIGPDQLVPGSVNGRPLRFQMLANGVSLPILNPDTARSIGLKAGWIGAHAKVGPVMVPGSNAVIDYSVAGAKAKRRALWFERPIATGADGALSPASVPQSVVIFQLRPARPGEQRFVLPMAPTVGWGGLGTTILIGGQKLLVQWDFSHSAAIGTAAAGADIAAGTGAQFKGAARLEPIRMGIERPVRPLVLPAPLAIGPIRLTMILTRTGDSGDVSAIGDADLADGDPGEIVVTGKNAKKSKAQHWLMIGRDATAGCSSIMFDKPAAQIILNCLPPG